MQTWLWVSYLNRVGFCYNYDENKMENLIGEMKDQYIQYFNKVEYFQNVPENKLSGKL